MYWYLKVLKNYINFEGRARRKEYWMFLLFHILFLVVALLLDDLLGTDIDGAGGGFFYIYSLILFLPALGVSIRRLHDTGKSGYFILINLIPFIGWIVVAVLMCIEGKPGYNKYGPNPKVAEPGSA